jgi:hypothetical protein
MANKEDWLPLSEEAKASRRKRQVDTWAYWGIDRSTLKRPKNYGIWIDDPYYKK